jgi:hypothetical protein
MSDGVISFVTSYTDYIFIPGILLNLTMLYRWPPTQMKSNPESRPFSLYLCPYTLVAVAVPSYLCCSIADC